MFMKSLGIVSLCLVCMSLVFASVNEKHSEVRIFVTSHADFQKIQDAGLFIDHAITKVGHHSDAWLSASEIELLKKSGVPYEILIEDWDTYYNSLPKMSQAERDAAIRESAELYNVSHSIYGSMGGYLTYAEVVNKLDSMRLEYPQFISQKFSIGTTYEGRQMWAVRVTKNPDAPTGRPEVMYHALIHAREPESMETQMYYFYWLFENYGTDPLATYILNNREIYWIPVFNVDGYVYNQTTNPNGGGNWRSNRHITTGSCGPVDLNRNYGIYQFWNSSNGGSSTDPCSGGSGTYRGTAPFSEPETQNMMGFVNSRNFNASFGAHTYGNYLIKPWAWQDPTPTPDDYKFTQYLADMKASNPVYTTGTPSQTVGYMVRGGSDDWYYYDSVHVGHNIIAMTPETGLSFWPAQNQIIPLAQGMLFNNQYMSLIAGPYVTPTARGFNRQTYQPGDSGTYKVVFRNKGLVTADNVQITLSSSSSYLTLPTFQFVYPQVSSFATDSCVFNFSISPAVSDNRAIPAVLTVKMDTVTIFSAPVYVRVGTGVVVLNDNATTFGNWTTTGTWAVTTSQSYSPPSSFTDSPGGNYGNNADNSMVLASVIRADSIPALTLSFWHKYATELNYDYCNVEISSNNGATWQSVASYSGTLSTWTEQTFDIGSYANGSPQARIRFRLTSDPSLTADGWYVDDVRINGYPLVAVDTGLVVRPAQLGYNGLTGSIFRDSVKVYNYSANPIQVIISDTTYTTTGVSPHGNDIAKSWDMQSIINRLRPAFQRSNVTKEWLPSAGQPSLPNADPEVYTTIITDERNENGLGGMDIYRVQYQLRTFLGTTYHDFRIIAANRPDTNFIGFVSLDTDQDFGTGDFPTPFGIGPSGRDIGSEREIFIDASGVIIDSLIGIGRIPAGVVVSTATDTIVGTPFLLAITRDSVTTITTTNILGLGIRDEWLANARNMNVGASFTRLTQGANPLPDLAPSLGHGLVGTEKGASWISENQYALSIGPGDSATVAVTALAARQPGTHNGAVSFVRSGQTVTVPVQMVITGVAAPSIALSASALHDTLVLGDSTQRVLTISNNGNADLLWGVADTTGASWVAFSPALGTISPLQSSPLTITLKSAGLVADTTYSVTLLILSNDPVNNTRTFPISLRVRAVTAIGPDERRVPTEFALHQNYPNPFNPQTTVSFDVPHEAVVTLKMFNLIGQEIATLVDGRMQPGTYTTVVSADQLGLSSGMYFYRLSSDRFVATKKMILVK
jgi:carboxypeptidase T